MADTRFRHAIEACIRETFLRGEYRQPFEKRQLRLCAGGRFEFDAVSQDGSVAATISTASARVRDSRRIAVGSINKIRSDMLFLMLCEARTKLVVLTEADMMDFWTAERGRGRVPRQIDFKLAPLPKTMRTELDTKKAEASYEIERRPTKRLHRSRSARR